MEGMMLDGDMSESVYKCESVVPDQVLYSSFLNETVIRKLQSRYPFMKSGIVGRSVMGKPIPYLVIGEGSRKVFYGASFHANENINTPLLLKFAEEYAQAYAGGQELYGVSAEELYHSFQLFLVPMVNPDGVDLVNGFLREGCYYEQAVKIAQAYTEVPFPAGWKANIEGTDLNVQFPAGWEKARENKLSLGVAAPAPRDYVGEAPLTAPEAKAVYEFTKEHDFSLILAYHTQGSVIYWKYLDYEPKGSREIARYFEAVSGYPAIETPSLFGYAGYKDWFIQEYNRPGYTVETGLGQSPLPMTDFPKIYQENTGILTGGMVQLLEKED